MTTRTSTLAQYQDETPFFLAVGDLMGALLLIFVLSLAATLLRLQTEYGHKAAMTDTYRGMSEEYKSISQAYEGLAETYRQLQDNLYWDLHEEFKSDLEEWGTVIDHETLAIRFQEPTVFFGQGQDQVPERFKEILDSFFRRYLGILTSEDYRDYIEEVRIEGHTSSEWESDVSEDVAYFKNMELSQNRTRNVLEYCLTRIDDGNVREWARGRITANGLSSSKLITTNGLEDKQASRRVEFRVRTAAEQRIAEILRVSGENANSDPATESPTRSGNGWPDVGERSP